MRRPTGQGDGVGCARSDRRGALGEHAERDHGRKRWAYQTIPSLRYYVLVDQDEGGVEVTSPNPDGTWRSVVLRDLGARLELTRLNVQIGLEQVFARVAFPGSTTGSGAAGTSESARDA